MENLFSFSPLIAVLIPVVATLLIVISSRWPNIRETWTIIAAVSMCGLIFSMLPDVLSAKFPEISLFSLSPGISLALRVDTVGIIFGLSASFLWIITSFYSIGYMRNESSHKQTRYYSAFALCLASTIGIAFSANLLTFIVFYEILTIVTYPLVIHKETPHAISAGHKYLAYLLTGGIVLIAATALTYYYAGTLDFQPGGFLDDITGMPNLMLLFTLFLVGFGMKSALIPLHGWLPSAMVAPSPVSGLLHINAWQVLSVVAAITIIVSSLLALKQDNIKRRLAYSTIGHLSYILLGISLLSSSAWMGGLMHLMNHAVLKITLFLCAGALYSKAQCENISDVNGIGKQMPITMAAFTMCAIGLVGLPPFNGFISKWFLGQGALEADLWIYMGLLLLSGLLNAAYFFPIIKRAYFMKSDKYVKFAEASPFMVIPIVVTAALALYLGLFPNGIFHLYDLARDTVINIMIGVGG